MPLNSEEVMGSLLYRYHTVITVRLVEGLNFECVSCTNALRVVFNVFHSFFTRFSQFPNC